MTNATGFYKFIPIGLRLVNLPPFYEGDAEKAFVQRRAQAG